MINKENEDELKSPVAQKESGYTEVAFMDMQCHLIVKDKDTGEILVNKRG
jgi:hypothetical protein